MALHVGQYEQFITIRLSMVKTYGKITYEQQSAYFSF